MTLADLVNYATDKRNFDGIEKYVTFCERYLEFIETGLQARIISQNEQHYQFFQYRQDGHFNITRPLNTELMYGAEMFAGTVKVPIKDQDGIELFRSSYQHDLLVSKDSELKIIGSVKTSSKDRVDKIFLDKFLYSKLTDTTIPRIAVFLNDVQRKKTRRENIYGIGATFLPGHFKAYTLKLTPLDGVYYCDIRPNMRDGGLLAGHIRTVDHFFYTDLWRFLDQPGQPLTDAPIEEKDDTDNRHGA